MAPTSRFLLVELAHDLGVYYQTRSGVFATLSACPGVLAVTDVSAISADTLTEMLLPPEQAYAPRPRQRRKARA